jgi:hypothetical protein
MKIRFTGANHKTRGLLALSAMLLSALACQAAYGAIQKPSPTSPPTATLNVADQPTLPPGSPGPTPEYNASGVRYCYYVPGVSVPAQMPPDVLATRLI